MDEIEKFEKEREKFVRKQEEILHSSNDPRQRKIAGDILEIVSGAATAGYIFEKEERERLDRWERLKLVENFKSAGFVLCKRCGYRRWPHKDYGNEIYRCPDCGREYSEVYNDAQYIPNEIPLKERTWNIVFALAFIVYIGYCVYSGAFHLPLKSAIVEFHRWAMLPAIPAILMLVMYLLSYVVDHYDTRNNEYHYTLFRQKTVAGYILLMISAFVIEYYQVSN